MIKHLLILGAVPPRRPKPPANQPPVNSAPASVTTPQNVPIGVTMSVADPDSPTMTVRYTIAGGTMQLAAGGVISGNDTSDPSVTGTLAQVNQSIGTAVYFPSADWTGQDVIQMRSDDGVNPVVLTNIPVTVTA